MSGVQFEIKVISGNSGNAVKGVTSEITNAAKATDTLNDKLAKIGGAAFVFNNIKSAVSGLADDFKAAVQPGIGFNSALTDMQAITGVTSDQLEKIGASARQNAKDFGGDAANSVRSYSLILSKLSPEIANNDVALANMGRNASVLSKQLGGDTAAATGILTTAMNQYGVSLKDPIAASEKMAEMSNVMSAAAKEGSAELPQISAALEQSGLMANTAHVSFEELNASIQVLDKAGKKGAEGGVAIRNVLAEIGQGARMPKAAAAALDLYGISTDALADNTKTFSERLALLKPLVQDTSAMTAIFGKENVGAATALVQSTGEIDRLTVAVTDTNAATDYSNVAMSSFEEKMSRAYAKVKDFGISIFGATESFLPFIEMGGQGLSVVADMGFAIQGFSTIANTSFGAAVGKMITGMGTLIVQGASMLVTYAAAGAMMVGEWVVSLVAATAAQIGLNVAMYANPVGLIVIGIAAVVGAIVGLIYYWDEITAAVGKFTQFVIDHNPFSFLIDITDRVFPGFKNAMTELWDWMKEKFDMLFGWIGDAWDKLQGLFGFGEDAAATPATAVQGFSAAQFRALPEDQQRSLYDQFSKTGALDVMGMGGKSFDDFNAAANVAEGKPPKPPKPPVVNDLSSNITGGGSRPTTINMTFHKLQDQVVIHTTNLQMGAKQAADKIVEEIILAMNGANAALKGS